MEHLNEIKLHFLRKTFLNTDDNQRFSSAFMERSIYFH